MEKQMNSKTKDESRNRLNICESSAGLYQTLLQILPKIKFSDFLWIEKKGKSPPGNSRSPGSIQGLTRDCKVASCKDNRPGCEEIVYQTDQKQYLNFYHN